MPSTGMRIGSWGHLAGLELTFYMNSVMDIEERGQPLGRGTVTYIAMDYVIQFLFRICFTVKANKRRTYRVTASLCSDPHESLFESL